MSQKKNGGAGASLVCGIFDSMAPQVAAVRGSECDILYLNSSAKEYFETQGFDMANCREGYGKRNAEYCERCPNNFSGMTQPQKAEHDNPTAHFSATPATWLDGKPATLITYFPHPAPDYDERLYELAYFDSLTKLPNRKKLREDFEEAANKEGDSRGIIAILDIDNFKAINDIYGYTTGDVFLKRFVGNLQANPDFARRLYRLGGDEFVVFCSKKNDGSATATAEALREQYSPLLAGALYSYTMPGIDIACTVSIGVSIFTGRDAIYSETLRKADVALYNAKSEGRNRVFFFDDRQDIARKIEDYYISIRPILLYNGKTYGYELIDSSYAGKTARNGLNLNFTEVNRAIDALNLRDLETDAHYFISYSNQLSAKALLENFPKDKFIISARLPDKYSAKDLEPYHALHARGYLLAISGLDGLPPPQEILQLFDYFSFAPGAISKMQKRVIDANPHKTFIASGVDTRESLEHAKKLGFRLFQGQFFNQPTVAKKEKSIDPLKLNYMQLLKLVTTDAYIDFTQVSKIISEDLALSYKLLRLLNSVAIGPRNRITSIPMAVSYLGEVKLKKWIALLAMRGAFSDKPPELVRVSLIRARFGELLAPYANPDYDPDQVFMFGLFSLLHIMLDMTPEGIFAELPMPDEIRRSMLTDTGAYSSLLKFFKSYEIANWDDVTAFADCHGLTGEMINDSYIKAINWYNSMVGLDS